MYEIVMNGVTLCQSPIPRLGYSPELIRKMLAAGYEYRHDGKPVKRI